MNVLNVSQPRIAVSSVQVVNSTPANTSSLTLPIPNAKIQLQFAQNFRLETSLYANRSTVPSIPFPVYTAQPTVHGSFCSIGHTPSSKLHSISLSGGLQLADVESGNESFIEPRHVRLGIYTHDGLTTPQLKYVFPVPDSWLGSASNLSESLQLFSATSFEVGLDLPTTYTTFALEQYRMGSLSGKGLCYQAAPTGLGAPSININLSYG
jgi:hypothetical protein